MRPEILALWSRAIQALRTARSTVSTDPDAAASRAYYAAFYAVSALFALQGKTFSKHSAVEAAVHRDLVHAGVWPVDLGKDYSFLLQLRETGDYGGPTHVSGEEALESIEAARRILQAVRDTDPESFSEDRE
ncbi:MAG: hypothetical protein A3F84_15290 [Candidatus Handelsmanbacteria bacterium RIFCSPLOWO2_12_FULL_64_10]|uniref:HEPN domain-containing protein n=1 Tax=Handelsmanbacteria sp. (strain RIFCSPLOWO2_12_FULL_64_10) TaxID=1817868 RepID=A0A1F6CSB9_HANXR|nr:MAG: hypothetical protein A3F84_15290 [Candidatus Handelsmanbacteria bacterium RIFCSPLOWO2_12_FULL_64_10]